MDRSRENLQRIFSTRWLKTSEVHYFLRNPSYLTQHGFSLLNEPPALPLSGTLCLYDAEKAKRLWRRDRHEWQARKGNPKYAREDQEKLRVEGKEVTT